MTVRNAAERFRRYGRLIPNNWKLKSDRVCACVPGVRTAMSRARSRFTKLPARAPDIASAILSTYWVIWDYSVFMRLYLSYSPFLPLPSLSLSLSLPSSVFSRELGLMTYFPPRIGHTSDFSSECGEQKLHRWKDRDTFQGVNNRPRMIRVSNQDFDLEPN